MTELQPDNTDAILGGQNPQPIDTLVLGGLEGIKNRLASKDKPIQISALQAALDYEDKGLDLLVEIWKNDSNELKWDAFSLLRTRAEEKVKQALTEYNPWLNLKCVYSWDQMSTAMSIAISPDGNTLFSGNQEQINVWDLQTNKQKSISFPYEYAGTLAVTNNGKTLVSRGRGKGMFNDTWDPRIMLWNLEIGEHRSIVEESCDTSTLVVSPCERFILYGKRFVGNIRVWDLEKDKFAKSIQDSKDIMESLAMSNDGSFVVGGDRSYNVKVWDFKTRSLATTFKHRHMVSSVAISPDDRTVVSGSRDRTVKVWDLQANKIKFDLKGHEGWVYSVAITPDGNYAFSSSSDKTIRGWDLHSGECVGILTGHTELIHCLVVSSDGKTLISSSEDKTIKVWRR